MNISSKLICILFFVGWFVTSKTTFAQQKAKPQTKAPAATQKKAATPAVKKTSASKKQKMEENLAPIEIGMNTRKMGIQTWTIENLNVDRFSNGDKIPEAKTNEEWNKAFLSGQPAWCYYNNDSTSGTKYGKLYNYFAVADPRGLAPTGWHIPTNEEWAELADYMGGEEKVGPKLKQTEQWKAFSDTVEVPSNESGFSGLPGGMRFYTGDFDFMNNLGVWWTTTEATNNYVWTRHLAAMENGLGKESAHKGSGLSVRCVSDQ